MLETATLDDAVLAGWRARVARARASMGWHDSPLARMRPRAAERARTIAIRRHATGTGLALAAPIDQLFTATEINEWALCAALFETDPARWHALEGNLVEAARIAAEDSSMSAAFAVAPPVLEESAAFARFAALSKIESVHGLATLVAAADEHDLLHVLDDDCLTLGSGCGGHTWPLDALPDSRELAWTNLRAVPSAIVTGSNGKTTTVRLLAACARAAGWRDGFNCTDGVFIAGEPVRSGDYSGPAGTRAVLRDARVEVAILETARGGILRRGLAAGRADVAVVTNVSSDHFGEYGIHDLSGLADTKLVVASVVGDEGLLVLNADDPLLLGRLEEFDCRIGLFARDADHPALQTLRARGGATSGVRDGRLLLGRGDASEDLGAVADMPLTVRGSADYNVSNIAGAALAARELGVSAASIAQVLARFGADPADNPGRLMRYDYRGAQILIDYAHNPDGLRGLMNVAARLPRTGRLAVILGQAGNRENADIETLAATAAGFEPDLVVIKEIENYLRGRSPGETPALIKTALLAAGLDESAMEVCPTELGAVRRLLEWARPGDVLVMPVHDRKVRTEVIALLAR